MTPRLYIVPRSNSVNQNIKLIDIILLSNHPDQLIIDKDSIGIDEIRYVTKYISYPPQIESQKTVIIHNSHNLTTQAQHAFLKTLEETPIFSQIVLFTHNIHNLLPTITSRCIATNLHIVPSGSDTQKVDDQTLQLYKSLLSNDISNLISQSSSIASNKENATNTLNQLLHLVRSKLKKYPSKKHLKEVRVIHQSLERLGNNANPILTIENAFLSIMSK